MAPGSALVLSLLLYLSPQGLALVLKPETLKLPPICSLRKPHDDANNPLRPRMILFSHNIKDVSYDDLSLRDNVYDFLESIQNETRIGNFTNNLFRFPDDHRNDSQEASMMPMTAEWNDLTCYYKPLRGVDAIERHLRFEWLARGPRKLLVLDTIIDSCRRKAALLLAENSSNGQLLRSLVILSFNEEMDKIVKVVWTTESALKSGEVSLKVLAAVSKLVSSSDNTQRRRRSIFHPTKNHSDTVLTAPEQYYAAWNARDIEKAISVFAEDAVYDDTAFAKPLQGADSIRNHLTLCSNCFPSSFIFQTDSVIQDDNGCKVAVEWHVENNGKVLPFTRGISIYHLLGDKIQSGTDFVDSTPIKTASITRFVKIVKNQIVQEPIRLLPWTIWIAYLYVVFLADGILPGANALQLEERTWQEVLKLSLNFFLVAPTLHLPLSPSVHPMLEAVFNLLLSWAALFIGFALDDRRDKPSMIPFGPVILGMQFLTSAFFLPYLATRTRESPGVVVIQDKPNGVLYDVAENRLVAPSLLFVGSYALYWGMFGRIEEFGLSFQERWSSFITLLSIDRVGSSFLVDLAIFGIFQSWWIDDDLRRRGVADGEQSILRNVGMFVPFFGLGFYLIQRPHLDCTTDN